MMPFSASSRRSRPRPAPPPLRDATRGAAVVTALLVVTLAVVIVSGMLWRQQVQIRSVENQRLQAQAAWVQRAAVDWARLILRDDQRRSRVDHLGEPWAVPIAETRLSEFLGTALRTDQAGETSFLSGRIIDAQARFNLANLVVVTSTGEGRATTIDPDGEAIFRRLLQVLGLNQSLAEPVARLMLASQRVTGNTGSGSQSSPRPPDSADDLLAVSGFTPEIVEALAPYIEILPERTLVNANTADAEVLAAVIDKLPLDRARELVRQRDRAYFNDAAAIQTQLRAIAPQADITGASGGLDVRTHYFLVYGLTRHERAVRQQVSLIKRMEAGSNTDATRVVWVRDTDRMPDLR